MTNTLSKQSNISSSTKKGGTSQRLFQVWADWVLLPPGYLPMIRRMLGACAILTATTTMQFMHYVARPYFASAWGIGSHTFTAPCPPIWLSQIIMGAYFLSCLALVGGARSRAFLLVPIATLLYYGFVDLTVATPHTVILLCGLIALLFSPNDKEDSVARRLIQLSIAICYGCSALRKITLSAFINGSSLASVAHNPVSMNAFGSNIVYALNPSHRIFLLTSLVIVVLEAFLCFAPFLKRLRRPAVWSGITLHCLTALFMNVIVALFSLIMIPGLLAFLDPKSRAATRSTPAADVPEVERAIEHSNWISAKKRSVIAAAALSLFWLFMPLRVYFSWQPLNQIALQDYHPWSFDMFVIDRRPVSVHGTVTDFRGTVQQIKPTRRMCYITSERELYGMSDYVKSTYPGAQKLNIDMLMAMNSKWWQRKTLEFSGNKTSIKTIVLKQVTESEMERPRSCECNCHHKQGNQMRMVPR